METTGINTSPYAFPGLMDKAEVIFGIVATEFGIPKEELRAGRGKHKYTDPKKVAAALIRKYCKGTGYIEKGAPGVIAWSEIAAVLNYNKKWQAHVAAKDALDLPKGDWLYKRMYKIEEKVKRLENYDIEASRPTRRRK